MKLSACRDRPRGEDERRGVAGQDSYHLLKESTISAKYLAFLQYFRRHHARLAAEAAENGLMKDSKLYRLRMRHNYTQQFVAEALGVATSTLGRWEKDPDKMHIDDLRKAAEFYKVSGMDVESRSRGGEHAQ
jgi:DNA-binding XRE family transcriptional regulator